MIISGERLQKLTDIAIINNGNPNNKYYSKQHFIINENINNKLSLFINANIIYVKTDYLQFFANNILPCLTHKFILITHNSDYTVGANHINILNNDKLLKWYGQNVDIIHPKLIALPIGIANSQWPHGKIEVFEQIITETKNNIKTQLLYVNFNVDTNHNIRNNVKQILVNKGYTFTFPNLTWKEYLYELSTYKFAICPEGNGPDCHRIWECLYLGVVPIVKNIVSFKQFKDLPILFIDDWNKINDKFLEKQYSSFINSEKYNIQKLDVNYWQQIINSQL